MLRPPSLIVPAHRKHAARRPGTGTRVEVTPGTRMLVCDVVLSAAPLKKCGAKFWPWQADDFERHVVDCNKRHPEEHKKLSLVHTMPALFGPEAGDVEFERWVKENAQAIREGRKKL